ncbi:PepSY domain-containing protein [Flavobacterium sp. TSSA_36]|uniref:PepSY domain-containing protein n=1 Tax=Flavobacterium sp. TSSA_36 TaxID=3447669 RepID=UPI003F3D89E8
MTLSFWRYAHLTLALFCSLFLVLAATTGVILAIDAIQENNPSYKSSHFEEITVAKAIVSLRKIYPEITSLSITPNHYVLLQGIDHEGHDVNAYVAPETGEILGSPSPKSEFIQWITALHRSLFLKETGRFIMGFISFLLALIAISGLALVLQRQKHIRSLFATIPKETFAQYYHIVLGRISLLPILVIAITGTCLTLEKFNFFLDKAPEQQHLLAKPSPSTSATSFFTTILLSEVSKIDFPFSDDPEEYYIVQLKDREIEVNQESGVIVTEKRSTNNTEFYNINLQLHTGSTSILWAIILALASINLLFFIYSGFAMTLKRRANRIRNRFNAKECEIIVLVGSENGSTLRFANAIQQQLFALDKKVFVTEMNNYTLFPKATHFLLFTATHGLGEAPSNANKFMTLLNKIPQKQLVNVSVVGFGSQAYPDFCGFAQEVATALESQNWAKPLLDLHTVNDKNAEEFVAWIQAWSAVTNLAVSTTPSLYTAIPKGLQTIKVIDKTEVSPSEETFLMTFQTPWNVHYQSGDLLAIYPANDAKERLYSIGKVNQKLQVVVKLHPFGLGSNFLNQLQVGDKIKGKIIPNPTFHFPKNHSKVALISNGTGIAPFLGMMQSNTSKSEIHIYCGFKRETKRVASYKKQAEEMIAKRRLQSFNLALSKASNPEYVTHLVTRDAFFFKDLLHNNGVIMICGSLAMQKDVEKALDTLLSESTTKVSEYKRKGQILTDCY